MTALLLEPHQDDAVLFASWTIIREEPDIATILGGGKNADERDKESYSAWAYLGHTQRPWSWPYSDSEPNWDGIREDFQILARVEEPGRGHLRTADHGTYDRVYAPWPEPGGHEQHNRIGELAGEVFGDRVTYYTTYTYGGPRTTGTPVEYEPEWILRKLKALACYESQILRGPRRFWMMGLDEYTRDIVAQP